MCTCGGPCGAGRKTALSGAPAAQQASLLSTIDRLLPFAGPRVESRNDI